MENRKYALLFDDDPDTADLVVDTLEDEFKVKWVSTKKELSNIIERDLFDFIVTDVSIEFSPYTGYQMVDELRKKYRITGTPVVVYSAVRNISEIKKMESNLFFAYVKKVGRDWQEKLIKECLRASKSNRKMVSQNVFSSYFEKINKMKYTVKFSDILNALKNEINISNDPTVEEIISMITNPDLDEKSQNILENILWNTYFQLEKK